MFRYTNHVCKKCFLQNDPFHKVTLNEDGVCSLCAKPAVEEARRDWDALEKRFAAHLDRVRGTRPYEGLIMMSGGKDSFVLLDALRTLQKRAPIKFDLVAVNVDQHIPNFPREALEQYFKDIDVEYHIEDQDTYSIIQRLIPEGRNVCSLCARLRRGILYRVAGEMKCNKIALGHHMDDIVGTLLLNLFYGGRMKAMPPILRSDDKRNVVIRPLAYVRESETEKFAKIRQYPVTSKGICGAGENLKRQEVKELIKAWDREFPGRIYNLFMSLQRVSPSHLMDKRLYDFHNFVPLLPAASADEGEDE